MSAIPSHSNGQARTYLNLGLCDLLLASGRELCLLIPAQPHVAVIVQQGMLCPASDACKVHSPEAGKHRSRIFGVLI